MTIEMTNSEISELLLQLSFANSYMKNEIEEIRKDILNPKTSDGMASVELGRLDILKENMTRLGIIRNKLERDFESKKWQ